MGKVTVITGGTSGIGRGIAEKILAESAAEDRVFVTYGHNEDKAQAFLENLPLEKRSQVILMKADMSSYEDMMDFVAELKGQADHIDWLVSNAGVSTYAKYEDYTFEEWTRIVNTNLSVPVFMVKELRPMMSEGGSILFTGSYAGQQAYSSSLVYGVTKAAIHFLAKSLVKEFEPKGITVNAIAPGFIETPWHSARTQESYDRINKKIALHRFGTVEEVADMAFAVLGNGYMNGSVVDIHGGYDFF
ncbi:MAG: SDR family NAD(P)-dependent oxidoreductase [Clostridia bacterium]